MTDWEARARELAEDIDWSSEHQGRFAADILRLGREMADARAEEIALELELRSRAYGKAQPTNAAECHICAAIARSTTQLKELA